MVYLIGVDHIIQHLDERADESKIALVRDFSEYLNEQAKSLRVDLIAEEFSLEALEKSNADISTAQYVSKDLGIQHLFCDLTTPERDRLNIGKSDHDKREQYWLNCISNYPKNTIIFICGNNHLESFKEKLLAAGRNVEILSKDWGIDYFPSPL